MPPEHELIQRVVEGYPGAREDFMRLFRPRLLRASLGFLAGQTGEAEDMVQDCFLVVWPRLAQHPPGEPLYPWLRLICSRLCYARRRCRSGVLLCLEDALQAYMHARGVEPVDSGNASVRKQQKLGFLREMIKRLEPASRQLIQLRNVNGMSYAQIGQILDLPTERLPARLDAARDQLRRSLEGRLAA